jgi:hypothetical protein
LDTVIYFILTIAYLILFVWGILLAKKYSWINIGNVVLIVILALFYDNGILALGKYIGEGNALRALNQARYWMHALFTPLLVLFAWQTLVKASLDWAKRGSLQMLILLFTLALIIIELVTVVRGLSLEPVWKQGVLSYQNKNHGMPIMIIGVSLSLLITSIIIWWKQKWPWYFVGIMCMGLTPALHFLKTNSIHNISEFLLMLALLATMRFQDKKQQKEQ